MKKIILIFGMALCYLVCFSQETGTFTDSRDGKVYKTVKIGDQIWMAENLNATQYRNGDLIATTTDPCLDLSGESTPKYQWAYDGNDKNVLTYGRLYTWYAVTDIRNICPTGWHVPTDAEWTVLTNYLGESIAAGEMKESGIKHWLSPNTGANNKSGFSALPGGGRFHTGSFHFIGSYGMWWSSTEYSEYNAWDRAMHYNFKDVNRDYRINKKNGFSVRCVKD